MNEQEFAINVVKSTKKELLSNKTFTEEELIKIDSIFESLQYKDINKVVELFEEMVIDK